MGQASPCSQPRQKLDGRDATESHQIATRVGGFVCVNEPEALTVETPIETEKLKSNMGLAFDCISGILSHRPGRTRHQIIGLTYLCQKTLESLGFRVLLGG